MKKCLVVPIINCVNHDPRVKIGHALGVDCIRSVTTGKPSNIQWVIKLYTQHYWAVGKVVFGQIALALWLSWQHIYILIKKKKKKKKTGLTVQLLLRPPPPPFKDSSASSHLHRPVPTAFEPPCSRDYLPAKSDVTKAAEMIPLQFAIVFSPVQL